MNRRERIIQIIGFNIEPERAELMADEIIALFEPKTATEIIEEITLMHPHTQGYSIGIPYNKEMLNDIDYIEMRIDELKYHKSEQDYTKNPKP